MQIFVTGLNATVAKRHAQLETICVWMNRIKGDQDCSWLDDDRALGLLLSWTTSKLASLLVLCFSLLILCFSCDFVSTIQKLLQQLLFPSPISSQHVARKWERHQQWSSSSFKKFLFIILNEARRLLLYKTLSSTNEAGCSKMLASWLRYFLLMLY